MSHVHLYVLIITQHSRHTFAPNSVRLRGRVQNSDHVVKEGEEGGSDKRKIVRHVTRAAYFGTLSPFTAVFASNKAVVCGFLMSQF